MEKFKNKVQHELNWFKNKIQHCESLINLIDDVVYEKTINQDILTKMDTISIIIGDLSGELEFLYDDLLELDDENKDKD